jgi:hypothetical protein
MSLLLWAVAPLGTGDAALPGGGALARSEASTARAGSWTLAQKAAREYETRRIARADAKRRYWLSVMQRPLPPPATKLARLALPELRNAADWRWQRALEIADLARHPPHLAAWRCIQSHETRGSIGAWRTNTGNGYYGGLQFDRSFQLAYGGRLYRTKGTAEHWTPLEQMWTAERAHASGRGFTPWPNTARACGLL